MPSPKNTDTFDISLHLSKVLTTKVKNAWESGELLESVSPTTQQLLQFWFNDVFVDTRDINFHNGQKQAILNIVYLHEVLQINSIKDAYIQFDAEILHSFLLASIDSKLNKQHEDYEKDKSNLELQLANSNFENFQEEQEVYNKFKVDILTKDKYNFIKYALKLATALGKTWIMNAIIIWQYLNKEADLSNDRWTNNFLLVAPGLIVYERLVESLKGKNGDIATGDIIQNQALFVPYEFRADIRHFLAVGVIDKDSVGNIRNGCIIVVNWHVFLDVTTEDKTSKIPNSKSADISETIQKLLPLKPKTTGYDLNTLDKQALNLINIINKKLTNGLMIINDEAHHIHENKAGGKVEDVKWQQAISLMQNKLKNIFQVDFSATPYITSGSGDKRKKHYFPHIITDFGLHDALKQGLVKLIVMDKSSELEEGENLRYLAQENQNGDLVLSQGQKTMIKIGLGVLANNKQNLAKAGFENKHPKMMITCEDTQVVKLVEEHLREIEGLGEDEFFAIHSKKKDEIGEKEYKQLKSKLFGLNDDAKTKVVVSVLMLKEGFDTNDICVIVPLRSTSSAILLEQTIGRGLRLMFRSEPDYQQATERRIQNYVSAIEYQSIHSHLDVLHLIEHPKFQAEYKKLMEGGEVAELTDGGGGDVFDMITIKLKDGFEKYDIPFINVKYSQNNQQMSDINIDIATIEAYGGLNELEILLSQIDKGLDVVSVEISSDNIIDSSQVDNVGDIRGIPNYKAALIHLTDKVLTEGEYPVLQHLKSKVVSRIDEYIKTKLFNQNFDPVTDKNWKILYIKDSNIRGHIEAEFKQAIKKEIEASNQSNLEVEKTYFSSLGEFRYYKDYCLPFKKTIYNLTPYPSNSGEFEKVFLELLDKDGEVKKFIKVLEFKHRFATIPYINDKNMMVNYYPDFLVETDSNVFIVETKAEKDEGNKNVQRKRKASEKFVDKINKIDASQRDNKQWRYVIINDSKRKSIESKNTSFLQLVKSIKS